MFDKLRDVLVPELPTKGLQVCVTVPVRNEEELLPSALCALTEQKKLNGERLPHELYEVILLINNTQDHSREIAQRFQRLYPSFKLHIAERNFRKSKANVGNVRRLLMDEACRRIELRGSGDTAILSTDADTRVARNWIAQNLEELRKGAEIVGGRVIVLPCERDRLDSTTRTLHRHDHVYRRLICWLEDRCDPQTHDPWPRHHQHFGSSLAIRPEVYKAVGRLPRKPFFEDVAFYDELIRRDVRIRHSNKVRVFTSARLTGRAPAGFSTQLAGWKDRGTSGLRAPVESARFLQFLFTMRGLLRSAWLDCRASVEPASEKIATLSDALRIKPGRIEAELRSGRPFGTVLDRIDFYEAARKTWPDGKRLCPLNEAVHEMFAQYKLAQKRTDFATPQVEGARL